MERSDLFGSVLTWLLTPSSPPWRSTTKKPIEGMIQVVTAGTGIAGLCWAGRELTEAGFALGIGSPSELRVFGFVALPMLLMIVLFWTTSEFQTTISDVIDWLFRAWTCILLLLLGLGSYYSRRFGLIEGGDLPFYARFWPSYLFCVIFTTAPMVLRFWYNTQTRAQDCFIGASLLIATSILAALIVLQPGPFWFPAQ